MTQRSTNDLNQNVSRQYMLMIHTLKLGATRKEGSTLMQKWR